MAEGLKRASAAAARSRWDGTITADMRIFLEALPDGGAGVTCRELKLTANRAQDRARQACRRLGLATYGARNDGRSAWSRTTHGDAAIAKAATQGGR